MRLYVKRPTLGQLLVWRIRLGKMQHCPDCGSPVTRTKALEIDRAWKQHLDYCTAYQARVQREVILFERYWEK